MPRRSSVFNPGPLAKIFFPVFVAGLLLQILALSSTLFCVQATAAWKPVEARIIRSRVAPWGTVQPTKTGAKNGVDVLRLQQRYRYRFGPAIYESENYGLGLFSSFLGSPFYDENSWVKDHPVGSEITVFVDPRAPANAAIDPGPSFAVAATMLLSIPLTLIGIYFVFNEEVQSKLSFAGIAWVWGLVSLTILLAGHEVGAAIGALVAIYFLALIVVPRLKIESPPGYDPEGVL